MWIGRLDSLRNTVRQHVIAHQLAAHAPGGGTALDVGCGQGTQALLLAQRGYAVTGVDPAQELLRRFEEAAAQRELSVEALRGSVGDLGDVIGERTFDVVCCHGLLMYLEDPRPAVEAVASRVGRGGLLSLTFRNAGALAYRFGMRRQWAEAMAAFEGRGYVNELGAPAWANTLAEVTSWCEAAGLEIVAWYGVRVFTDAVAVDEPVDPDTIEQCLRAEVLAGERDPYRALGSQLHVVAQRR